MLKKSYTLIIGAEIFNFDGSLIQGLSAEQAFVKWYVMTDSGQFK